MTTEVAREALLEGCGPLAVAACYRDESPGTATALAPSDAASPEVGHASRTAAAGMQAAPGGLAARLGTIDATLRGARRISLRAGARLYERGSVGDSIYLVERGIVKESTPAVADGERIVRLVSGGGITGLDALTGERHAHSARVMHPGLALRVPATEVLKALSDKPELLGVIVHEWQQAVHDADFILSALAQGSGRQRLARALLYLCAQVGTGETMRLPQGDLAALLALNKVSVARLVAGFRRERLIRERGRRCVGIDRPRVAQIALGRR